jgi:hypothetical protein
MQNEDKHRTNPFLSHNHVLTNQNLVAGTRYKSVGRFVQLVDTG